MMKNIKYLVLGGGAAGLSFASKLKLNGETDFLVLEKENTAGGLCRSEMMDGAPVDTGGGHFLDTRDSGVLDFLFGFMPEDEWNLFERDSRIEIHNVQIGHPMEANIWQLSIDDQIEYLKSIAAAGCNTGMEKPEVFSEWITWKLGRKIADDYMLPYNRKMFGNYVDELGTYWLDKLPSVSFEETLRSCLTKKAYGKEPAHAKFYYPKKYGYGEVWKRIAESLKNKMSYGSSVVQLDVENRIVNNEWKAEYIINTCPWDSFEIRGISDEVRGYIQELAHTSVVIEYQHEDMDTQAQWIYIPDENKDYHRLLIRKNFIENAKGYWTETNAERYQKSADKSFLNMYAYPLNLTNKPLHIKKLLSSMKLHHIFGLGRWGEWEHLNSDVVVRHALNLADALK